MSKDSFNVGLVDPAGYNTFVLHVKEQENGRLIGTIRDTLRVGGTRHAVVLSFQLGDLDLSPDLVYAQLAPWLQSLSAAVAAELAGGENATTTPDPC